MNTPAFTLPQLEQSIRILLDKTGEAEVELNTFLAAVEATAGKTRWTLKEMVKQTAKACGAAYFLEPPKAIRFITGSHGHSANIRVDELAYQQAPALKPQLPQLESLNPEAISHQLSALFDPAG